MVGAAKQWPENSFPYKNVEFKGQRGTGSRIQTQAFKSCPHFEVKATPIFRCNNNTLVIPSRVRDLGSCVTTGIAAAGKHLDPSLRSG